MAFSLRRSADTLPTHRTAKRLCQALLATPSVFRNGTQPVSPPQTRSKHSFAPIGGLSLVKGPATTPLHSTSLYDHFFSVLLPQHAERPALTVKHEPAHQHGKVSRSSQDRDAGCLRWSFAEMSEHIDALARGLVGMGVRKGDRVAVCMMNNSAYAALQWASAKIGAILVTINPSYRPQELLGALNHVSVSHLIVVPSLRTTSYIACLNSILPTLASNHTSRGDVTVVNDPACPSLRRIILVDNISDRPDSMSGPGTVQLSPVERRAGAMGSRGWKEAMEGLGGRAVDYRETLEWQKPLSEEEVDVDAFDTINIQFTSGTTSSPKAVELSSHNLLNNAVAIGDRLTFGPGDVLCNVPPLFHCFGLTLGNLAAWTQGAACVYPSEGFNPVKALRACSEERCTALHGVPTHFISELIVLDALRQGRPVEGVRAGEEWDFSSLRTGLTSGSPVPVELMHRIRGQLNLHEQTVAYGMTETSPVSFQAFVDDSLEARCETVGRVLPHVQAKIVDPADDSPDAAPLPIGQPGELCTAGYLVMKGYWQDKEQTEKALKVDKDGVRWMYTGDIAVLDEEGFLRIVGRSKDVIIRGGENLYPVSIENVLDAIPYVVASAVVAVPDANYGEAVGAFVARAQGADGTGKSATTRESLREGVKEKMSGQSAPEWIWFLGEEGVPAELPKTASGKVKKNELREWAKDLSERGIGRVSRSK